MCVHHSATDQAVSQYHQAHRWVNVSSDRRERYSRFLPQMRPALRQQLVATWRTFHHAVRSRNLSYFLVDGSLLGAFRHQGVIPWDDDVDVAIDVHDADAAQRALSCVPGFSLRMYTNHHWKFFATDAEVVADSVGAGTRHAPSLREEVS